MALLALMSFTSATFADDPSSPLTISNYVARIRVACVGDSITFGMGVNGRESNSYPVQLNRMLGDKWEVQNFGVSARTLLNKGDYPYQKEAAFQNALNFNPNVVVILLGANDSKPLNWKFKDEFVPDYKELIGKFKALAGHPQIFICRPTPVPGNGNWGINEPTVQDEIKLINGIAKNENVGIIDLHRAL
jgi:lysophospholipase L1-like esterase